MGKGAEQVNEVFFPLSCHSTAAIFPYFSIGKGKMGGCAIYKAERPGLARKRAGKPDLGKKLGLVKRGRLKSSSPSSALLSSR